MVEITYPFRRVKCFMVEITYPRCSEGQVDVLNKEQERLKSELKSKTEELNLFKDKLNESYSLAKKTVKLAEPQPNWVVYGITDKK